MRILTSVCDVVIDKLNQNTQKWVKWALQWAQEIDWRLFCLSSDDFSIDLIISVSYKQTIASFTAAAVDAIPCCTRCNIILNEEVEVVNYVYIFFSFSQFSSLNSSSIYFFMSLIYWICNFADILEDAELSCAELSRCWN